MFGVIFGDAINNKTENAREDLWRKTVHRSALVQKVCDTPRRDLQRLVQLAGLWWMVEGGVWWKGRRKLTAAISSGWFRWLRVGDQQTVRLDTS